MKYICKRLEREDVRQVCIRHNYYTAGTCEEYEEMFSMLDKVSPVSKSNITTSKLEMIANDIKEHSVTSDTLEEIMETLVVHIRCSLTYSED